ncbi:MAG TPA: KGK domain-containing protein [Oculatellaceae cyanobacterium]|jgi:hypothetical protein
MENKFEPLAKDETVCFEWEHLGRELSMNSNYLNECTLKNDQLIWKIIHKININDTIKDNLFLDDSEGVEVQALKFGANGWQKGKIRIRMNVEFCPDETEVIETPTNNQPETNQSESPLDDLRRMINQESDQ